jgi:DNA-binding LytR/AlgR family response regulator
VTRRALRILGVWSVVTVAAALQTVVLARASGGSDLVGALARRLAILPLWIAVTPLVLRSATRFPLVDHGRRPRWRHVALHLALGTLFVVAANVVIRVPDAIARGVAPMLRDTAAGLAEFMPLALLVYLTIVVAGQLPLLAAPVAAAASDATAAAPPECLTVHQWDRVHLVRLADIDWIEAEGNYVVVHAAGRRYRGRERISDVETRLDARRFVRIHRSTIVPVARVREVQPLHHGDHAVILHGGQVLRVARSRRDALQRALAVEL